jgi:hypothetical protein
MAPPPPQEDDSDGAVDKAIRLRRSPQRRVNSNIAGRKGKQKKNTPTRKQVNRGTNDGEKGKRKQKERSSRSKKTRQQEGITRRRQINPQEEKQTVQRV